MVCLGCLSGEGYVLAVAVIVMVRVFGDVTVCFNWLRDSGGVRSRFDNVRLAFRENVRLEDAEGVLRIGQYVDILDLGSS